MGGIFALVNTFWRSPGFFPAINIGTMADAGDRELQEFVMMEQQKAQLQGQIHKLTDTCWEKCIDKPRDKFDYKTEGCLTDCVERFIDVTIQVTGRFQQKLQAGMQ